MAYTFVGSASAVSTLTAISYTSTAGNLIVAMIKGGSTFPTGVQDNNGNTFTAVYSNLTSGGTDGYSHVAAFYLPNCPAATSYSVIGGSVTISWRIVEYAGIATASPLITNSTQNQAAPGTAANAITSPSATVGTVPALILGLIKNDGDGDTAAGTGFTSRVTANNDWLIEDQRALSTGSYAATATAATHGATDHYSAFLLAFAEASTTVLVGNNFPTTGGTGATVAGSTLAYSNKSSADVATQTGVVGSLNIYFASAGSASHVYMGLYDNGNNLLCGGFTTISAGINTIAISLGPSITLGTQYHIFFETDGSGAIPVDNGTSFALTNTSNSTFPLPATLVHSDGATVAIGRVSMWADSAGGSGTFGLAAATGTFTLTGEAATLSTSSGSFSLTAAFGSYALSGQSVTLSEGGFFTLIAFPGSFDYLGGLSTSDYQLDAAFGTFATAGQIVSLNFNGNTSFGFTAQFGSYTYNTGGFGGNVSFFLSQAFTLVLSTGLIGYTGGSSSFSIAGGGVTPPPAPGTVLNLEVVTDAFQKIGVIDETQAPTAEQGSNGLRILNDYLLSQARDGMRLGWFTQTDLAATAPLRPEDLWGVKTLLAKQLAIHYGVPITDPNLAESFVQAEHWLTKRTLRYMESDFGELSRAQGGPWGLGGWF